MLRQSQQGCCCKKLEANYQLDRKTIYLIHPNHSEACLPKLSMRSRQ
jgi:hypothetical protein